MKKGVEDILSRGNISEEDFIHGMNDAGININAFFLSFVFRRISTDAELERHNFVIDMVEARIGKDNMELLDRTVADNLEQYSLRNIENGKKNKKE